MASRPERGCHKCERWWGSDVGDQRLYDACMKSPAFEHSTRPLGLYSSQQHTLSRRLHGFPKPTNGVLALTEACRVVFAKRLSPT